MMGSARGAMARWEEGRARNAREKEQLGLSKKNVQQKQQFKKTELPSNEPTTPEVQPASPQIQQPTPIPDQAINKVSSTPFDFPKPSVSPTPTENPYLKKEATKDARSEAKAVAEKRIAKLWNKDEESGGKPKTPDLGETFKGMFGGGNAQDAKKQQKEKALKTLLELE